MQAEVNIDFEQLMQLAKKLPSIQWGKFTKEVKEKNYKTSGRGLASLLLSAPTHCKKQLDEIAAEKLLINGEQNSFSRYFNSY